MDDVHSRQENGDASLDRQMDEVADEFVERLRRGDNPSVREYIERYPDLEDRIRECLPAIAAIEGAQEGVVPTDPDHGTEDGGSPANHLETIGQFRILRLIGRGGMGVVYEAEETSLGRHVALKVLPPGWLSDTRRVERFRREAKAAGSLSHPNIVKVHAFGEDQGMPYFAMEYVSGQGLDQILVDVKRLRCGLPGASHTASSAAVALTSSEIALAEREPESGARLAEPSLPSRSGSPASTSTQLAGEGSSAAAVEQYVRNVARLGRHVAIALDHAHSQGIVHRDIKPSNLLLDSTGTPRVTDFGLAKEEGAPELTHTGEVVGTLRYLAPERLKGWSDPRSDIYSLGLTIYELLTLEPAFPEGDRGRLVRTIVEQDPIRPRKIDPRIPKDLETIVLKSIAKEPGHRYQRASDLATDLGRFLAGEPIEARPAGPLERSVKWARRQPAAAALLTVCALALLGFLAGLSWHNIRLQLQVDETIRERERADESYRKARDVVFQLAGVVQDELSQLPFMDRTRQELLDEVVRFHEAFLRERGDDPTVRLEAARAYQQLGDIHRWVGETEQAVSVLRAGLPLAKSHPQDPEISERARVLGDLHASLGSTLAVLSRKTEAREQIGKAIDVFDAAAARFPNEPDLLGRLVDGLIGLAILSRDDDPSAARSLYLEAAEYAEKLVGMSPTLSSRVSLATSHGNLVTLYTRHGEHDKALASCRRAREALEQADDADRDKVKWRSVMASILDKFADTYRIAGRPKQAISHMEESVRLLEGLHEEHPAVPIHKERVASHLSNLGALYEESGNAEQAGRVYDRALTLLRELVDHYEEIARYRILLARTAGNRVNLWIRHDSGSRSDAREHQTESLTLWEELVDDMPGDSETLYGQLTSWNREGVLLKKLKKLKEARAAFTRATVVLQKLLRKHPDSPRLHAYQGGILLNLADVEFGEENYLLAKDLLLDAVGPMRRAFLKSRRNPDFLSGLRQIYVGDTGLLETCLHLNEPGEVQRLARQAAIDLGDDPDVLYKISASLARALRLLLASDNPSETANSSEVETCVREAVRLLNRAVEEGFDDFERLLNDPDLNALQGFTAYREWLSGQSR